MPINNEDFMSQEQIMQLITIVNQLDNQNHNLSMLSVNIPVSQIQELQKITCDFTSCKRKLSILDREFECRCGKIFCKSHKFFESHQCTFDYKTDHAKKIKERNPKIESHKIDKI